MTTRPAYSVWSRGHVLAGWMIALLVAAPVATAQPVWSVDRKASTLTYTAQAGEAQIHGRFGAWIAKIALDPYQPEAATLEVEIDMASVAILGPGAQAVGEAAWLDIVQHPRAEFKAKGFLWARNGALTVPGLLTLKGLTVPLTLTGALHLDGSRAEADVTGTILRLDHEIGVGQDAVAAEVEIRARVIATRQTNSENGEKK